VPRALAAAQAGVRQGHRAGVVLIPGCTPCGLPFAERHKLVRTSCAPTTSPSTRPLFADQTRRLWVADDDAHRARPKLRRRSLDTSPSGEAPVTAVGRGGARIAADLSLLVARSVQRHLQRALGAISTVVASSSALLDFVASGVSVYAAHPGCGAVALAFTWRCRYSCRPSSRSWPSSTCRSAVPTRRTRPACASRRLKALTYVLAILPFITVVCARAYSVPPRARRRALFLDPLPAPAACQPPCLCGPLERGRDHPLDRPGGSRRYALAPRARLPRRPAALVLWYRSDETPRSLRSSAFNLGRHRPVRGLRQRGASVRTLGARRVDDRVQRRAVPQAWQL
jgi:hypothetical protein